MSAPRSICLLRLSAIGDTCNAAAVVHAIRQHYPEAEITWVIGKAEAALMAGMDGVNFVVFDKKQGMAAYRNSSTYTPAALAAIMLTMTFLTNFASNATAATVGTPIAFAIAAKLDLPPEPLVLAVLFGCNLCYATPIAYQTNMLIMAEGSYEFKDYVRTGVPLVLIMVTLLSVGLAVTYQL